MQTTVLFVLKILLLVMLWVFIYFSLRTLRRSVDAATPTRPSASQLAFWRRSAGASTAGAAGSGNAPGYAGGGAAGAAPGSVPPGQAGAPAAGSSASAATRTPGGLVVTDGPEAGAVLSLVDIDSVVVGRSAECTLPISDDYASSRHARLTRQGSAWFIKDLDSRNGTFINGQRIDQTERVTVADSIRIGQTELRLVPMDPMPGGGATAGQGTVPGQGMPGAGSSGQLVPGQAPSAQVVPGAGPSAHAARPNHAPSPYSGPSPR